MSSLMARLKADNAASSVSDKPLLSTVKARATEPSESKAAPATNKSVIQQLLQGTSSSGSFFKAPPPFFMCSESEATDRQSCLELSPFEYLPTSNDIETPRRSADATWDANEIQLDFSPTPKKSSLAAALSTPPKSAYYSKVSNAYVPPSKRSTSTTSALAATPTRPNNNTTPISTVKKASRVRPTFHPQLVIKKYRRSAAGGGVNEQSDSARSLDQLSGTVDYLMELFARQSPPSIVSSNDSTTWGNGESLSEKRQFSLCETVNFVDDRLRAVQKDLVTLVGDLEDSSYSINYSLESGHAKVILRQMQAKMVRYNILALYLLSDVPADKYQTKFGTVALRTCLTSYMNLSRRLHEEYDNSNESTNDAFMKELRTQDEIMSYVALFHMASVLRSEESALPPPSASSTSSSLTEESGSGWGALFTTFTKYVTFDNGKGSNSLLAMYPRWKWAIELAASVQSGNYQYYFSLLEQGPTYQDGWSHKPEVIQDNARFLILARSSCSPSLNLIRLSQLRRYNHAFGKAEKVPAQNLERLLNFDSERDQDDSTAIERVIEFCRDAGLPIGDDGTGKHVTMKTAPISILDAESIRRMCSPGRSNDAFVFGSELKDHMSLLAARLQGVKIDRDIDNWEDLDFNAISSPEEGKTHNCIRSRVDIDGIKIPESEVLVRLLG